MKYKLVLLVILSLSCNRRIDNIKQPGFSESEFLITQDSTIAKLDRLSYVKDFALIDDEFKMKFILDSQRINISAYDSMAKLIWRTDPWLDNKLMVYCKWPRIIYFGFVNDRRTGNKEVIEVDYNSTQFGVLDKRTGTFTSWGQD